MGPRRGVEYNVVRGALGGGWSERIPGVHPEDVWLKRAVRKDRHFLLAPASYRVSVVSALAWQRSGGC